MENEQILRQEWEYYYPKVYGYFFRRVDNKLDVEELTSLVLEKFFRILLDSSKTQTIKDKNSYLWAIARNALINFIKQKQAMVTISLNNLEELENYNSKIESLSIENFYSQRYQKRVLSLLECLKKQVTTLEYEILKMSFFEEMNSKEIAQVLHLTAVNIRQKISRSLKKVRENCKQLWLDE